MIGHSRQYSQAKVKVESLRRRDEIIHMTLMKSTKAHQQQIVSLQYAGTCRKIISASQDHTLKVSQKISSNKYKLVNTKMLKSGRKRCQRWTSFCISQLLYKL